MGATQTTFCNEANIPISTGLSVVATYYFTSSLLPQQCVTYYVGRVWFTAFTQLPSGYDPDGGFNQIYFLTDNTTAIGIDYRFHLFRYLSVTEEEAEFIMKDSDGFVTRNFYALSNEISAAYDSVYTERRGYYGGSSHKIRVTGGPGRIIVKSDDVFGHVFILPYKAKFSPFALHID